MSLLINPVYGNPTPDSFSLKSGTGSATGIDMQVRKQNDTSMITMGTGFDPWAPSPEIQALSNYASLCRPDIYSQAGR